MFISVQHRSSFCCISSYFWGREEQCLDCDGRRLPVLAFASCCHNCLFAAACRTMSGAPLTIADSQLMLPQPEWQLIAQAAKNSRNFAVQLEGELHSSRVLACVCVAY